MKILILGAKGMLGQALYRGTYTELNGTNAEIIGWDREEIDITNKEQVAKKISLLAPEVIINAAAYNNVDKAETEDRELAMKVNGEAVGYLAEAADRVGAVFVHYSSDYVFDGAKKEGYKEDDKPNPQSLYAETKYEGEKKILSLRAERSNPVDVGDRHAPSGLAMTGEFKFYLVRTSRLFGPAGTGEGAKKSFVDKMLKLGRASCHSRESGNPDIGLDVVDEETSSPTYVNDLARATRELIESGAPWGICHRTNDGACTWYGWAKKIFELAGLKVKLNTVPASKFPRPAARPKYSVLLNTKLPAMRRWEEALEEYLNQLQLIF